MPPPILFKNNPYFKGKGIQIQPSNNQEKVIEKVENTKNEIKDVEKNVITPIINEPKSIIKKSEKMKKFISFKI